MEKSKNQFDFFLLKFTKKTNWISDKTKTPNWSVLNRFLWKSIHLNTTNKKLMTMAKWTITKGNVLVVDSNWDRSNPNNLTMMNLFEKNYWKSPSCLEHRAFRVEDRPVVTNLLNACLKRFSSILNSTLWCAAIVKVKKCVELNSLDKHLDSFRKHVEPNDKFDLLKVEMILLMWSLMELNWSKLWLEARWILRESFEVV